MCMGGLTVTVNKDLHIPVMYVFQPPYRKTTSLFTDRALILDSYIHTYMHACMVILVCHVCRQLWLLRSNLNWMRVHLGPTTSSLKWHPFRYMCAHYATMTLYQLHTLIHMYLTWVGKGSVRVVLYAWSFPYYILLLFACMSRVT